LNGENDDRGIYTLILISTEKTITVVYIYIYIYTGVNFNGGLISVVTMCH